MYLSVCVHEPLFFLVGGGGGGGGLERKERKEAVRKETHRL